MTSVIGTENAGHLIVAQLDTGLGDGYVTGVNWDRGQAVTWHLLPDGSFSTGHYFIAQWAPDASTSATINLANAVRDMHVRAHIPFPEQSGPKN